MRKEHHTALGGLEISKKIIKGAADAERNELEAKAQVISQLVAYQYALDNPDAPIKRIDIEFSDVLEHTSPYISLYIHDARPNGGNARFAENNDPDNNIGAKEFRLALIKSLANDGYNLAKTDDGLQLKDKPFISWDSRSDGQYGHVDILVDDNFDTLAYAAEQKLRQLQLTAPKELPAGNRKNELLTLLEIPKALEQGQNR